MNYTKQDALMTRGLAITSMIVLHLFCRQGADVYGTPLLWINETTPFVFLFGFFAEICVPLYTICAGYARQLSVEQAKDSFKERFQRIMKLMINYWVVLLLFCVLGLLFDKTGAVPGNITNFIKSIFLLHSYNGAWWYLSTYVIFMLIPACIVLLPVAKIPASIGIFGSFAVQFGWYIINKLQWLPVISSGATGFIYTEVINFIGVLPYFWIGAFLCKCKAISLIDDRFRRICPHPTHRNAALLGTFMVLFVIVNILHKAVLMGIAALAVFFLFNLWEKDKAAKKIFTFLGKHSTNIWLTHMFFYLYIFEGMIFVVKFPVLIFLFLLCLCIGVSIIINPVVAKLSKCIN